MVMSNVNNTTPGTDVVVRGGVHHEKWYANAASAASALTDIINVGWEKPLEGKVWGKSYRLSTNTINARYEFLRKMEEISQHEMVFDGSYAAFETEGSLIESGEGVQIRLEVHLDRLELILNGDYTEAVLWFGEHAELLYLADACAAARLCANFGVTDIHISMYLPGASGAETSIARAAVELSYERAFISEGLVQPCSLRTTVRR